MSPFLRYLFKYFKYDYLEKYIYFANICGNPAFAEMPGFSSIA
jgi:hypothetical protein